MRGCVHGRTLTANDGEDAGALSGLQIDWLNRATIWRE